MSNFKQIFNERISMLSKNPEDLVGILSSLDSNLDMTYNDDRTILINGSNNTDTINTAINKWAGELTCPTHMIYDILPLSEDTYLLKV